MTVGHLRTRDHLIYFLLLAMASCFASGLVLFLILQRALFFLLDLPIPAQGVILTVAVVWHSSVLWRRLTPALPAPSHLVATGQIRVPLRQDWRATLRMAGWSFLGLAALETWRFLATGYGKGLLVSHEMLTLPLLIAKPVFAAFLGLSCLGAARREPEAPPPDPRPPSRSSGRLFEGVRLCLHAAILATAGMLLGTVASHHLSWLPVGKVTLTSWGAHAGALVAIHRIRVSRKQRWVLSCGLVAEAAGVFLLGAAGALGVMFAAVLLFERYGRPAATGTSTRTTWWNAARAAWGFSLGSLAGAMAGRLAGGLAFGLFGVVGVVTGEALGQVFLALAGYMALRRGDEQGAHGDD